MTSKYQFNLKRDPQDERDIKFRSVIKPVPGIFLPPSVDLRPAHEPVYDQSSLGSCTANAGVAYRDMLLKDVSDEIKLSRLYLYYKERELEGTIGEDAGACMRTICKALNKFGVCEEHLMPYSVSAFAVKPSEEAEAAAASYKILSYQNLQNIKQIKECLALKQKPVLLGMKIFSSFETISKSGIMPMPGPNDQDLGGHAVLVVGYHDNFLGKNLLIVRNSWGPNWGDNGYFYMPYEFVEQGYAFDFWTID